MAINGCICSGSAHLSDGARANLYRENFIPRKWRLSYFHPITERATLILEGYCKNCYEELEEMVLLPESKTADEAFERIYDTICSAHPYSNIHYSGAGADRDTPRYYGGPKERLAFYQHRDQKSQYQRNTEFLRLFDGYDREAARLWLDAHHPLQGHTEVLRDTGGSLFCTALRIAKEHGDYDKAAPILDYVLPSKDEEGLGAAVELTAYEFDFLAIPNFGGSEGIYLDCYLRGKFDESGRNTLSVGTLKTLRRDLAAAKIMAELGGALMYHASHYVDQNIHRYTPGKELLAEAERIGVASSKTD